MNNDLIRRSDAIHELIDIIPYKWYHNGKYLSLLNRKECLAAIKAVPTIDRPQEKWIPCNKKLPKLGEYVLATILMFDGYRSIGIYSRRWTSDHSEIRWFSDDEYGQLFDYDVVAWMPLPKPWKGKNNEYNK